MTATMTTRRVGQSDPLCKLSQRHALSALNRRGRINAREWYRLYRRTFDRRTSRELVVSMAHDCRMGAYWTQEDR